MERYRVEKMVPIFDIRAAGKVDLLGFVEHQAKQELLEEFAAGMEYGASYRVKFDKKVSDDGIFKKIVLDMRFERMRGEA